MTYFYTRLPLDKTYNTRELGGYATADGITKTGVFVRSDDLSSLDRNDISFLMNYGITTIIDLRSIREIKRAAYPDVSPLKYINIPLVVGEVNGLNMIIEGTEKMNLGTLYIGCIEDSKERIKSIFNVIAESKGGVLFHCVVGKDRTGIISALLLGLVGVRKADIVANYQTTYTYIKENPINDVSKLNFAKEMLHSDADYIELLLSYINENYGSVENYLLQIGISAGNIETIKMRFVYDMSINLKEVAVTMIS